MNSVQKKKKFKSQNLFKLTKRTLPPKKTTVFKFIREVFFLSLQFTFIHSFMFLKINFHFINR